MTEARFDEDPIDWENDAVQFGILRRSGRFPWGSGGSRLSRSRRFVDYIDEMRSKGLSDGEICQALTPPNAKPNERFTTTMLRATNSQAKAEIKASDIAFIERLADKGLSNSAIGKRFDPPRNESSIRALREAGVKERNQIVNVTSEMLKRQIAEKGYVDVGVGVEHYIGVSRGKLDNALVQLRSEGYHVVNVNVDQLGTGAGKKTRTKVLAGPGKTDKEHYIALAKDNSKIQTITEWSDDGGRTTSHILPPLSISSKRIQVRYDEDGGSAADGVLYVRPGPADLSLGRSNYAQVRVAVDGTHYMKGMAVHKDDLPDGVDIIYNSAKSKFDPKQVAGGKLAALKEMKADKDGNIDTDNPFGAVLKRQIQEIDAKTGEKKVTSAMNIINEEGDWQKWKKTVASQVLSKQSPALARQQLDEMFKNQKSELDEIRSLTNPSVKKALLEKFSDGADVRALDLKAAAFKGQASHALLPVEGMNEREVFAPNYRNGDSVYLIRYPHGGKFEIPELTVNNNHPEGRKVVGEHAQDAIGISPEVAKRLSGADFDGDTVLVIPRSPSATLRTQRPLEGLKDFDPQKAYPYYEGMKVISPDWKQKQMGVVSNLITDMTIRGANDGDIAAAVRHSMVVIDAEKHKLNWKQSEIDNRIGALKDKYQTGGASTIISRAGSEVRVNERRPRGYSEGEGTNKGPIDKKTGEKVFVETGNFYERDGQKIYIKESSTRLKEAKRAGDIVGDPNNVMENIYASHSDRMKALANQARLDLVNTKPQPRSPSARKVYDAEVASLNDKFRRAVENKPRERAAQIAANAHLNLKRAQYPDMDAAELKKVKSQVLIEARARMGASKYEIKIEPREWEAIQAGAISPSRLDDILKHVDTKAVKELATPRIKPVFSEGKAARAQAMLAAGSTQAEVAQALGISLTTLKEGLK